MSKRLRIGIIVGEVSGDTLGANLIRSFKALGIDADFEGIGGPQMNAEGFHSLHPMETLSVMGLVEVVKHLNELLAVKSDILKHWQQHPVDLFIGIDAPDFNLRIAKAIKKQKLPSKTVQYVSPSVWAWRQKRVFAIKAAVDLVLCLFPFEVEFYRQYQVPAVFVGHPLAKQLPLDNSADEAKAQLSLNPVNRYIALLPGSRRGEVARLLPTLLESVQLLQKQQADYQYLIPAINAERAQQIRDILAHFPSDLAQIVKIIENQGSESNIGRLVMQAADAVVLASGTATLEALLLHRPMVVIYKLHWLTYQIAKQMIKIPYVSLPNIIAKTGLVSELIQDDANAQNICLQLHELLHHGKATQQQAALIQLHQQLAADKSIQDPAAAIMAHFKSI